MEITSNLFIVLFSAASSSEKNGFFSTATFGLILLIWLIVITVIMVIFVCLFIYVTKRTRRLFQTSRAASTKKNDMNWRDPGHDNLYIAYVPDRNETDSAKVAAYGQGSHPDNGLPTSSNPNNGGLRRSRSGNVSEFSYSHLGNSGEGFKGETTKEFPIETVNAEDVNVSRIGEFMLVPDPSYTNSRESNYSKASQPNGVINGRHIGPRDSSYRM